MKKYIRAGYVDNNHVAVNYYDEICDRLQKVLSEHDSNASFVRTGKDNLTNSSHVSLTIRYDEVFGLPVRVIRGRDCVCTEDEHYIILPYHFFKLNLNDLKNSFESVIQECCNKVAEDLDDVQQAVEYASELAEEDHDLLDRIEDFHRDFVMEHIRSFPGLSFQNAMVSHSSIVRPNTSVVSIIQFDVILRTSGFEAHIKVKASEWDPISMEEYIVNMLKSEM